MIWREKGEGPVRVVGYCGSDGTFAWAWPGEGLMVLLFSQSRGQDVQMEVEEMLPALLGQGRGKIAEILEPYLGRYGTDAGPYAGQVFTILTQDGKLALDIPGQAVFTLRDPDPEGWRAFTQTDQVAVRFMEEGQTSGLELVQVSVFPRQGGPDAIPLDIPEELSSLVGDYLLPGGRGALTVTWSEGTLAVAPPGAGRMPLYPSTAGTWKTQDDPPKEFSFRRDRSGAVTGLGVKDAVVLRRLAAGGE